MNKYEESKGQERFILWEALKTVVYNNIDFFKTDESTNGVKLYESFSGIIDHLEEAKPLVQQIELFFNIYDYSEETPGNGYRSFIKLFDCAINHTSKIVKYVTQTRSSLLFRKNNYTKEIEACGNLLASMITCLNHLVTLHEWSEDGNLFPVRGNTPEDILERARAVDQFAFYGRCLGFQFCDSIKPIIKFIAILMASYSESYYSDNNTFIKATNSMFSSGKYLFDPELRSRRIVNISQNSSVDFCKSFWFLTENEIMNTITLVSHGVSVNRRLKIMAESLKVPTSSGELIEIPGVGSIQARIISSHRREGMVNDKKQAKNEPIYPKSKSLLFHCHGGGFVAQSSKSHLVYLNEWANHLNIPILSIDYSLAPEAPYPLALNEILFAYCWALNNCELLGSTCEKIILAGDSAGANLCLATLLKCIDMKIRKPDGIYIAYCPILVGFDPSPSRMLCLMDPLLTYGFIMRCLKAYSHSAEDFRHNEKLEEIKRAKASRNEELKLNQENDLDTVFSEEEKSDSFEEISCFERHQTDSNPQAQISQVSEGASNDTLAGASLLTGTDNKDININNTIEIISPIDSIRSATSLEEDSLPITIQKNEKKLSTNEELIEIELPQSTSMQDNSNLDDTKFVDDYIEKYIVEAKQVDDGTFKPFLRQLSKTSSEENIVLDVSREMLTVQNLQEKVQSVVDTVSSTLTEITTSNRPIIRNCLIEDVDDSHSRASSHKLVRTPSSDFIFTVPKDPFMSPFYADDDALRQFPPIKITTLSLCPFLDDSITFAKRLRDVNVDIQFDIVEGLPHGFLNFSRLSKEAHEGSKLAMARIAELFAIKIDQDETKVKYFC